VAPVAGSLTTFSSIPDFFHRRQKGSHAMPKMSFTVPYSIDQAAAIEKLKSFVPAIKQRYGGQVSNVTEEWVGDILKFAFTTFGFTIKGDLDVQPNQVVLDGELPFAAMMFKGKIESEFKENLAKLLS
jgi:hypothetical protein